MPLRCAALSLQGHRPVPATPKCVDAFTAAARPGVAASCSCHAPVLQPPIEYCSSRVYQVPRRGLRPPLHRCAPGTGPGALFWALKREVNVAVWCCSSMQSRETAPQQSSCWPPRWKRSSTLVAASPQVSASAVELMQVADHASEILAVATTIPAIVLVVRLVCLPARQSRLAPSSGSAPIEAVAPRHSRSQRPKHVLLAGRALHSASSCSASRPRPRARIKTF